MVEKDAPRSRSVHDRRFIGRRPEQLIVLVISPTIQNLHKRFSTLNQVRLQLR
jgi:hypothetical protein